MANNTITFTGNENKIYDLDVISQDTRVTNGALKIHVHKYNDTVISEPVPDFNGNYSVDDIFKTPNPINAEIGQIWLAVRADL